MVKNLCVQANVNKGSAGLKVHLVNNVSKLRQCMEKMMKGSVREQQVALRKMHEMLQKAWDTPGLISRTITGHA